MLRQIAAVTFLNFKSLSNRFWPSLVIVIGMACVIGVLISMLSFNTGYVQSEMGAGDPGRGIVISDGREREPSSSLTRDQAAAIMDGPGIRKDADGAPLAEGEILFDTPAIRRGTSVTDFLLIRGLGSKGLKLRPELKIVSGRMLRPGSRELIVGKAAQDRFVGMAVGDKIILPGGEWPIVGIFSTGGDIQEGQFLADRDTLMAAVGRNAFNSVLVRLESAPNSLDALKAALTGNPALSVIVERHSTYYEHLSGANALVFSTIAYTAAGIMAVGAMFGALKIMYGGVSARTRQIGTLRALGFGALPVAISVVSECLLLALIGALIGSAIAWLLFNGAKTAYWGEFFDLKVSPGLIGLGILWAVAVAFLGGLLPAIHAARLPIVEALRAT
ncbi:MAG TPA: ABC transporter permease [Rhizomicrobium sp.]|nr:ABC transporter permease [Rhizomicrobium sp.]